MNNIIELPNDTDLINDASDGSEPENAQNIVLPIPQRRDANEPDVVDLTLDDEDENGENEIEEIEQDEDEILEVEAEEDGNEGVEVLHDLNADYIMNAFHQAFNVEEEEPGRGEGGEEEGREGENIVDVDNDLIIEESVQKSDEEKRALMKDNIDSLLTWLKRLKPEHFKNFKVGGSHYLTGYTLDEPFLDEETCVKIAQDFKEVGSLDGLAVKWNLENDELLIASICMGILKVDNAFDIDFGLLSENRIDEWSCLKCEKYLDSITSGVNQKNSPLKFMQFTATSPASAILLLTYFSMVANEFPCKFVLESGSVDQPIIDAYPYELATSILDASFQYWQEGGARIQPQMAREINEFFHQIDAASAEMKDHFENTLAQEKEIDKLIKEKAPKVGDIEVFDQTLLTKEQRTEIIKARSALTALKEEMRVVTEAADKVYTQKTDMEKYLVLKPGEFCLARAQPHDEVELAYAITQEMVSPQIYKVKFLHSDQVVECHIRDLALTNHGLCNPIFHNFCDVGLRVAVCVSQKTGQYDQRTHWMTGTTAGRRSSHRGDFLVFLDDGQDIYATAPVKPGDTGYEIVTAKKEGTGISYQEVLNRMKAAKIAVMVGQPLGKDGIIDWSHSYHWVRPQQRSGYIRQFMRDFPECPLLRMHIGMRIFLISRMADRRKRMVTVVAIDRAFATVRHDKSPQIPGSKCFEYPCTDKTHVHEDENVYRGSHRLEGAAHKKEMLSTNNNLSKRRKGQFASQFEPTDADRSMPQRNLPPQAVTPRIPGVNSRTSPGTKKKTEAELEENKKKQQLFEKIIVPTPKLAPLRTLVPHNQCGPDCLMKMDADPYDSKFHRNSPIHTPLLCGWRRLRYTMHSGKKRATFRKVIVYYAPCGKPLNSMAEVSAYLNDTRSQLQIDCFSFEPCVDTETYVTVNEKYVKNADLAGGIEGIPIPLVNSVDNDPPPNLVYSSRRFPYDATVDVSSINQDFCSGCTCEGDCSVSDKCECQILSITATEKLPVNLQYDQKVKVQPHYDHRILANKVITGLYECNDKCPCKRKACHNRVVQNNIKYPMQIFKTAESGWGCRALTDIPVGAFICTYVGALLTNELADELKNDDQYFADLDLKDSVELEKGREDHETDFGYGGEESEEDSYSDKDEDDSESVTDKTVTHRNRHDSKLPMRVTRQSREEEKVANIEFPGAEQDPEGFAPNDMENNDIEDESKNEEIFNWDEYFDKSALYVVDAKVKGNLGRFLNHSCAPNTYVQHVMYDTHDLRLPWVAFFTSKHVNAGDELTWDYQYTELDTESARLSCKCGALECRGRLL
ncbi:hypothetical protein GCK72_010167 [Caenorhabditis remanei]|uniref:Uncharacterized protein n=1 Tax=Caenorhabditis remanei TaxID=31234 RepID=A0A6A5H2J0_CAERE|nr:hypothetical protein GCK72_010167 [Caenorhabditis remanei]KAF1761908.1 hypothetical protein GCK72_010167 [Caenorhabditis remanei]